MNVKSKRINQQQSQSFAKMHLRRTSALAVDMTTETDAPPTVLSKRAAGTAPPSPGGRAKIAKVAEPGAAAALENDAGCGRMSAWNQTTDAVDADEYGGSELRWQLRSRKPEHGTASVCIDAAAEQKEAAVAEETVDDVLAVLLSSTPMKAEAPPCAYRPNPTRASELRTEIVRPPFLPTCLSCTFSSNSAAGISRALAVASAHAMHVERKRNAEANGMQKL